MTGKIAVAQLIRNENGAVMVSTGAEVPGRGINTRRLHHKNQKFLEKDRKKQGNKTYLM